MLKRSDADHMFPGLWAIPGGHIEEGETVRQALCMETYEETGLFPEDIVSELEELRWRSEDGVSYVQRNFVVTVNLATSLRLNAEEHSEWQWTDGEDVKALPISRGMTAVCRNAFRFAEHELGGNS